MMRLFVIVQLSPMSTGPSVKTASTVVFEQLIDGTVVSVVPLGTPVVSGEGYPQASTVE
jgi:hypothetical protein